MFRSYPPPLVTERTVVRRVAAEDLEALLEVNGDDEVTRYLPYESWRSLDDGRGWYERMEALFADGQLQQYAICLRESGRAVGTCQLFRFDDASLRAELGYVLGRRHWGRGLMREALGALIGHAFGALELARLEAEVDPRNLPSDKLLLGLGFRREGRLRERWLTKGRRIDSWVYGLLAREWPAPDLPDPARLVPVTSEHVELFFRHQLDPESQHMAAFTPTDPSDREAFLTRWLPVLLDAGQRARTILFEGEPVGHVVAFRMDGELNVGYGIDRAYWGRGIASRALARFLEEFPSRPLVAHVAADNPASIRVLERNGFEQVGEQTTYANARRAAITERRFRLE